jgi:hypothetical protein
MSARLARDIESNFLGPFVSYEEKKCCQYGSIAFVTVTTLILIFMIR